MRELMLIIHFIGLAMGLGTSFGFMFLGMAASKMEKNEALKFTMNTFALSRMGHIGLGLLILSGLYLIIPFWSQLTTLLIVKLVLVVVLGALIGILSSNARKLTPENASTQLIKIRMLGQFSLLTSLAIVVLAVLNFQ